jgi:hypothetical protein
MLVLLLLVQVAPGAAILGTALRAQALARLVFAVLALAAFIVVNPRQLTLEPGPSSESQNAEPIERPVACSFVQRC